MHRDSINVDREPVQHPVCPGYLVTESLSSIDGVAKQFVRVVGKPIVSGLDVASNPYFLVAACRGRALPKLISQSISDPTGIKVTIGDHKKRKRQPTLRLRALPIRNSAEPELLADAFFQVF